MGGPSYKLSVHTTPAKNETLETAILSLISYKTNNLLPLDRTLTLLNISMLYHKK